jgi:hypothetical protein
MKLAVIAVLGLLSGGAAAWASRTDPRPCQYDIHRFCYDVDPGGGRLRHCLEQHRAELTEACRKDLDRRRTGR